MNIAPPAAMTDRDLQAAIKNAMADHPGLCHNGLYRMPLGNRRAYGAPRAAQFSEWRRELGERLEEVRQALTYLDECKSARTFTCDSYGLKHRAENLHLTETYWSPVRQYSLPVSHGGYWPQRFVSNGAMIAACLIRSFRFRLIDAGPNCELALQEPKPCRRPRCSRWLPAGTRAQICRPCREGVEPDPQAESSLDPQPGALPTPIQPRHKAVGVMDCEAINAILNHRHWGAMQLEGNRSLVLRPNAVLPAFPLPTGMQVAVWPWVLAKGLGINVRFVTSVLRKAWDEHDRVYMGLAGELSEFCEQVDGWVATLVDPNIPRPAWSWVWSSGSMRDPRGNWSTSRSAFPIINTHPNQSPADLPEGWGPDWAFGLRHERG